MLLWGATTEADLARTSASTPASKAEARLSAAAASGPGTPAVAVGAVSPMDTAAAWESVEGGAGAPVWVSRARSCFTRGRNADAMSPSPSMGPGETMALATRWHSGKVQTPMCRNAYWRVVSVRVAQGGVRGNSTPPEAAALGFFGYPITGSGRVVGFWRETTAVAPSESELAADSDMAVDGLLKDYG